jgi:DNA-binding transcriptional MerR regulator
LLVKELTKLYYSIGEVAELFDVSTSLIRYWESEFPTLRPGKNNRGERKFTVKDIEHISLIYSLVKERGFTLEGAKKEISGRKKQEKSEKTDSEYSEILSRLRTIRAGLMSLKSKLDAAG